jgi:hypothetical protein
MADIVRITGIKVSDLGNEIQTEITAMDLSDPQLGSQVDVELSWGSKGRREFSVSGDDLRQLARLLAQAIGTQLADEITA